MIAGTGVEHIWNDWYEPVSTVADGDFTMLLEWLRGALLFKCWSMCMWHECLWTSFLLPVLVSAKLCQMIYFHNYSHYSVHKCIHQMLPNTWGALWAGELSYRPSRRQGTPRQIGYVRRNRGPQTNYRDEEEAVPSAPTMMSLLGSLKLESLSDENFKFHHWTLKTG